MRALLVLLVTLVPAVAAAQPGMTPQAFGDGEQPPEAQLYVPPPPPEQPEIEAPPKPYRPFIYVQAGLQVSTPGVGPNGGHLGAGVRPTRYPIWAHAQIQNGSYYLFGQPDTFVARGGAEARWCARRSFCILAGLDAGMISTSPGHSVPIDRGAVVAPRLVLDFGPRYVRFQIGAEWPTVWGLHDYQLNEESHTRVMTTSDERSRGGGQMTFGVGGEL